MAYDPFPLGQQPMSSSRGVVLASDQTPVSVAGTVGASILGVGQVNQGDGGSAVIQLAVAGYNRVFNGSNWDRLRGNSSVGALVSTGESSVILAAGSNPIGSVTALQGTNPWVVQLSSGSVITTGGNSSVQVVGLMPPQSVSGVGTFNINPIGNGSVFAVLRDSSVAALQGTNPWVVQLTSGSVITTGGDSSVQVVGLMPPQSVSGVGLFNVNHTGNGSIITLSTTSTNVSVISRLTNSSVAVLQGTNPWVVGNSSVLNLPGTNTIGSIAVLQGTNPWVTTLANASIAGTYAEDSAHSAGERGLFTLGVRNDTVASFTSANLDYGPVGTDSAGRTLTKPFAPVESSFVATASTVNAGFGTNQAASVRILAAPGAGLKWYVTDLNVSNTGATTTLVRLTDDSSNTLWKGIAPTGGGSNMPGLNTPIVSANANTPLGLVSDTASSVVHVWVAGYKAP